MNKEILIKLLTGVFAKWTRYALTTYFGGKAVVSASGETWDADTIAAGIVTLLVTVAWSHWEDWMKKRQAAKTNQKDIQPGITPLPVEDEA